MVSPGGPMTGCPRAPGGREDGGGMAKSGGGMFNIGGGMDMLMGITVATLVAGDWLLNEQAFTDKNNNYEFFKQTSTSVTQ